MLLDAEEQSCFKELESFGQFGTSLAVMSCSKDLLNWRTADYFEASSLGEEISQRPWIRYVL